MAYNKLIINKSKLLRNAKVNPPALYFICKNKHYQRNSKGIGAI